MLRLSRVPPPIVGRAFSLRATGMERQAHKLVVYLLAGEASGDRIGARLMQSLRARSPRDISFHGVGGPLMKDQGLKTLFPMDEIAVMGFAEVIPKVPAVWWRIRETVKNIAMTKPDVVVGIDAKGFTLRVLSGIRRQSHALPHAPALVQYVAPSVWARKKKDNAVGSLQQLDHLMTILPFERNLWSGVPNTFVGYPVLDDAVNIRPRVSNRDPWPRGERPNGMELARAGEILTCQATTGQRAAVRDELGLSHNVPVVCLLPGSREQEVNRMLPIMRDTMARLRGTHPEAEGLIVTLPAMRSIVERITATWQRKPRIAEAAGDQKYTYFGACDIALAASGSVVVELSLARVPMVVAFRAHPITEWIARRVIVTPYASVPNLVLNRPALPEFLLDAADPEAMARELGNLLSSPMRRASQRTAMECVLPNLLEWQGNVPLRPSERAADVVLNLAAVRESRLSSKFGA